MTKSEFPWLGSNVREVGGKEFSALGNPSGRLN